MVWVFFWNWKEDSSNKGKGIKRNQSHNAKINEKVND